MILTTVRLAEGFPAGDVKAVHDAVIQAALAGETLRPVLWAQPSPHLLIIRHDRPITATDFPPKWVDETRHAPYWLPPQDAHIEWAVTVDAGQSSQSHGQWAREIADIQAGRGTRLSPRAERKRHRVRTPERMLELVTARLAPTVDITAAVVASRRHRVGHRPREGRVMHSNPVLLRGAGTVTDAPALHALMRDGIGRHRAFGCGLIIARPATARELAC